MSTQANRAEAVMLLDKIIENQPNLFVATKNNPVDGEKTAEFCVKFIETYVKLIGR